MKSKYEIYNRSSDTVIISTSEDKYILNPKSKHVLSLTAAEYKKYNADDQLIIRGVAR